MRETGKGERIGGMGLRPMLRERMCKHGLEGRATNPVSSPV